jgi:hypothetical protein
VTACSWRANSSSVAARAQRGSITDSPVQGAQAPNSTQSLKRIDARTFETLGKVDGKVTVTTRVTISPDGKMLTATQTGKNPEAQTIKNVIVAEKQ